MATAKTLKTKPARSGGDTPIRFGSVLPKSILERLHADAKANRRTLAGQLAHDLHAQQEARQ